MTVEQMIEHIISRCSAISKEEVSDRLELGRRKTGGFISDEVLLRMIAAELGVEVHNGNGISVLGLSAADLVPNLNSVTVVGRVVAVFSPKAFNGSRSGKFASFLIADKSGLLRVVLWNDKTCLLESSGVKVGQVVRVLHGYTKEGRSGKVEVHVGAKAEIEMDPEGVDANEFPDASKFTVKIGSISHTAGRVNIEGAVECLGESSVFDRQDSSVGKVLRFVLVDESGKLPVVVWNEKVDELERMLVNGVGLRLVDVRVKKGLGEGVEAHVDSGTYAEFLF